jgi:hypothetical protein
VQEAEFCGPPALCIEEVLDASCNTTSEYQYGHSVHHHTCDGCQLAARAKHPAGVMHLNERFVPLSLPLKVWCWMCFADALHVLSALQRSPPVTHLARARIVSMVATSSSTSAC